MKLSLQQLNKALQRLEGQVPQMMIDRNTFPTLFEEATEQLLDQVIAADQAYALEQLEKIVERSGFNQ